MPSLKSVIERSDTKLGRTFDMCVQSLIVLSLITFSIETLPNLPAEFRAWLRVVEICTIAVFTVEYVVRAWVATPTRAYVFSFFGIVDLLSVLPFYIGLGIDLRSVRSFRLLRLFRLFKLARYSAAVRRFHRALEIAKEEIVLFLCATLILLYLAAVGIHHFESEVQPEEFGSVFHCL